MANTTQKKISFYQYAQPGFQDGNYAIVVNQGVDSLSTTKIPASSYTQENRFAVIGPRFSLDPGDVVSMFPPPFSLGEFSNVLPHVVLSRITLPWERSLGVDDKANDAPWLGVILFDEADPAPPRQEKTLLDLLPITQQTGSGEHGLLPADIYFPKFPLNEKTNFPELDFGETWSDKCQVVDLPVALFDAILPTADDLGWLAHVREIELMNKSETYLRRLRTTSTDDDNPLGRVAEVVGNRFPLAGRKSVAHLVCLEQFGPILSGQSKLPEGTTAVRIVSLQSWTFSAVSQEYTFAGLLLGVNRPGGVFNMNTLQVPFSGGTGTPGDKIVANAFQMGFAAFDHTTRLGDSTVSWFHGPFAPYNVQTSVPVPGNVADQFTRYNPDAGMFDVAYSAAWQLGRLLGLQSNSYATALYNWKRRVTKNLIRSIEREYLSLDHPKTVALLEQSLSGYVGLSLKKPKKAAPPGSAGGPIVRPNRLAAIRKAMADPEHVSSLFEQAGEPAPPAAVTDFIARLKLLYGVPFNYLVPDERMLPSESMRFFYLDGAWVDSLVEGALSIGNATTADAAVSRAVAPFVHAHANAQARAIRTGVLKMRPRAGMLSSSLAGATGFVLRSQVVTGWPGMEVVGYDAAGARLDFLRLEQVGPGVLLCIFDGVAQKVVLQEHPEALHFGVDEDVNDPSPAKFTKSFRYVTAVGPNQPGAPVEGVLPLPIPPYTRRPAGAVLEIDRLAGGIKKELADNHIYTGSFTSAEFALEMIEGVQRVTFEFVSA
jgi:hypothetical protein